MSQRLAAVAGAFVFVALALMPSGSPGAPVAADELWRAAGVTPAAGARKAADFTLPDTMGQRVRLEQFRGRLVMLYFWATW